MQGGRGLGQHRAKCGSGNSHGGSAEVAEYENIVEDNVGHGHNQGVDHQHPGAGDGYEKCPEHDSYRGEQETEHTVSHIVFAGLAYGGRRNEDFE